MHTFNYSSPKWQQGKGNRLKRTRGSHRKPGEQSKSVELSITVSVPRLPRKVARTVGASHRFPHPARFPGNILDPGKACKPNTPPYHPTVGGENRLQRRPRDPEPSQ